MACLTAVQKKTTKYKKAVVVDLTGADAADELFTLLSAKSVAKNGVQTDLDEFPKHAWLLPAAKQIDWENVRASIREAIGASACTGKKASKASMAASSSGAAPAKAGLKAATAEVWAAFG